MPNWFGPDPTDCGCECTECINKAGLGACECLDGDYGNYDTVSRVDVVLSGAATCYEWNASSGTGGCNGGSFTGADWSGTYAVSCSSGAGTGIWYATKFACTHTVPPFAARDYYVYERLSIGLEVAPGGLSDKLYKVTVTLESIMVDLPSGDANPCNTAITSGTCTWPTAGTGGSTRIREFRETLEYDDDLYTNCSGTTQRRGCVTSVSSHSTSNFPGNASVAAYCDYPAPTVTSVTIVNV